MDKRSQTDVERAMEIYREHIEELICALKRDGVNFLTYKNSLKKRIDELELNAETDAKRKRLACLRAIFNLL
ncbi:hypothetical protein [Paraburkholderia tropica]|uniref:hypothetical protein n=1 Tax=Paraburkholderia tropica TaxID=92647 RepID=UPI003D2E4A66